MCLPAVLFRWRVDKISACHPNAADLVQELSNYMREEENQSGR